MIQRIQTLYLFLAAAAGVGTWFFDLWEATISPNPNTTVVKYFNAQSSYLFFILMMLIVGIALVCIFLFKKWPLQFRLTILDIILSVGAIFLQYYKIQDYAAEISQQGTLMKSTYLPAAILPVIIIILLFLAARGIYKDQKLVKSLDRLR